MAAGTSLMASLRRSSSWSRGRRADVCLIGMQHGFRGQPTKGAHPGAMCDVAGHSRRLRTDPTDWASKRHGRVLLPLAEAANWHQKVPARQQSLGSLELRHTALGQSLPNRRLPPLQASHHSKHIVP